MQRNYVSDFSIRKLCVIIFSFIVMACVFAVIPINVNSTGVVEGSNSTMLLSAHLEELYFHYPIEVCSDLVKCLVTSTGQ